MPDADSPAILVARFLKSNNYEKTLDAFIAEANLPPDAGSLPTKDALTLETVLEEKRAFDTGLKYSKGGEIGDTDSSWAIPAPSVPHVVDTVPSASNLLKVLVANLHHEGRSRSCLVASAADRKVSMLSTDGSLELVGSLPPTPVDSPVLDVVLLSEELVVAAAMSGFVSLYNLRTKRHSERRDHKKFVVEISSWQDSGSIDLWLATAGWDARVLLYHVRDGELGEPVAEVTLQSNPESLLLVKDPDTERLFLLVSRRDSSFIYYHLVNTKAGEAQDSLAPSSSILTPAGSQNLAPHSNAWSVFSPSSMAVSPTDPTLIAVATSSLPHMKAIIVRLLFPSDESINTTPIYTTQAEQGMESLAKQNREEAAIRVHVSTMAPQTAYSTPKVCWRPDGTGIFVNGDDGVLRGIEAQTGKVVSVLKDGHEIGSKIRSIWCGYVGGQEWLVSGGFDKRLIIWRLDESA